MELLLMELPVVLLLLVQDMAPLRDQVPALP
jgi:hypothetical protein